MCVFNLLLIDTMMNFVILYTKACWNVLFYQILVICIYPMTTFVYRNVALFTLLIVFVFNIYACSQSQTVVCFSL